MGGALGGDLCCAGLCGPLTDVCYHFLSRLVSVPPPRGLSPNRHRCVASPGATINVQVNLAVYGHHHSYQRTCLVANEVCLGVSSRSPTNHEEYRAPVHVILGTAGMGLVSET